LAETGNAFTLAVVVQFEMHHFPLSGGARLEACILEASIQGAL
jgi:hypothetical protein